MFDDELMKSNQNGDPVFNGQIANYSKEVNGVS